VRRPEEVFILVRRGDEFLVLHRSPRQGSYWHCAAGALEPGETFSQAAARELREETGLLAEPTDVNRQFVYSLAEEPERIPDYEPGTTEIVVRSFLVEAPRGWEPELDWEHDDYRWCGADDAVELLYWPEPAHVLREVAG
jgi:8-oxo-dGTP pyrophosphatase MutT (NUDIX family)